MLPMDDSRVAVARILRWTLAAGIALLLGVALLRVFDAALFGAASAAPSRSASVVPATSPSWSTTVFTTDQFITVTLEAAPNRTGTNSFRVRLVATSTGRALAHASLSLFLTMLDMKMATTPVTMYPDGAGQFHGRGELLMGGDWEVRLLIRTADQRLHEAHIHLLTPA